MDEKTMLRQTLQSLINFMEKLSEKELFEGKLVQENMRYF